MQNGRVTTSIPPVPAVAILLVGSSIAAMAGYDAALNAASFGYPWIRASLFAALAMAGLHFGRRAGLSITFGPLWVSIAAAVGVTCSILLIELIIFRSVVSPDYLRSFTSEPLSLRLLYFCSRAIFEEILYRLFVMSVLAYLFLRFLRPIPAFWLAIIAAQVLLFALNLSLPPSMTLMEGLYMASRFGAPGIVWGWLYWRYGLLSAMLAHVGSHFLFQPIMGL